jgi:hypothetical protein
MDLNEFADQVNAIEKARCVEKAKAGAFPPPLAAHYPSGMLRPYHAKGMTPEQAHAAITEAMERENAAMLRCCRGF